jgi:hypothetical protein
MMSNSTISPARLIDIEAAVQRVYENAGIEFNQRGIVPLHELIRGYPIRRAELDNLTYLRAIEFLLAETGQTIPTADVEDRLLAGFLYIYEFAGIFYGFILVKKNDPVARQRFSAAHELGHYILHFLPLLESKEYSSSEPLILTEILSYPDIGEEAEDLPMGQLTFAPGYESQISTLTNDYERVELEANQFAAELLMPSTACYAMAKQQFHRFGRSRPVLARRLATEFLVSKSAMNRRLKDLNLPDCLMSEPSPSI